MQPLEFSSYKMYKFVTLGRGQDTVSSRQNKLCQTSWLMKTPALLRHIPTLNPHEQELS